MHTWAEILRESPEGRLLIRKRCNPMSKNILMTTSRKKRRKQRPRGIQNLRSSFRTTKGDMTRMRRLHRTTPLRTMTQKTPKTFSKYCTDYCYTDDDPS